MAQGATGNPVVSSITMWVVNIKEQEAEKKRLIDQYAINFFFRREQ